MKNNKKNEIILDVSHLELKKEVDVMLELEEKLESNLFFLKANNGNGLSSKTKSLLRDDNKSLLSEINDIRGSIAMRTYKAFPVLEERKLNLWFNQDFTKVKGVKSEDFENASGFLQTDEDDEDTCKESARKVFDVMKDSGLLTKESMLKIKNGDKKQRAKLKKFLIDAVLKSDMPEKFGDPPREMLDSLAEEFVDKAVSSYLDDEALGEFSSTPKHNRGEA